MYYLGATNVSVSNKTQLVSEGPGDGSTFVFVTCNGCNEVVGKSFKSTTMVTDKYRDRYSFDMDKIKSFVLGSCELSRTETYPKKASLNLEVAFRFRYTVNSPFI